MPPLQIIVVFLFVLIALFGTFHVSYRIAKSITDQLQLIERKTRAINAGDFGIPLPISDIRELSELTESINTMSNRLKTQISSLSLEKEKFDSLLQNLKEGVFAIDLENRILFQNNSIPERLIPPNSQLRRIQDAIKHEPFLEFLKTHLSDNLDGKTQLEIGRKFYSIKLYTLKNENKLVMFIGVVIDKTEEREMQLMREEFIQSASHELKTPITAIKGYTETLSGKLNPGSGSIERRFLDAIERNTDRMIRIVDDMLLISKLENQKAIFQPELFPLRNLVEELDLTTEGLLSLKKQQLKILIPDALKVYADPLLIEHVLLNLIKNASSYSPEKTSIFLRAESESNKFTRLEVIDEGIGIAEEERERVFERFYRVDKNRSRKEGGTGLGLSIVKHIVRIHGGTVEVVNNEPKGSKFILRLPMNT